jgi:hypothetical protein
MVEKEYAMAGGKPSGGSRRKAPAATQDPNAAFNMVSINSNGKTNGNTNGASRNGSAVLS